MNETATFQMQLSDSRNIIAERHCKPMSWRESVSLSSANVCNNCSKHVENYCIWTMWCAFFYTCYSMSRWYLVRDIMPLKINEFASLWSQHENTRSTQNVVVIYFLFTMTKSNARNYESKLRMPVWKYLLFIQVDLFPFSNGFLLYIFFFYLQIAQISGTLFYESLIWIKQWFLMLLYLLLSMAL